MKTNNSIENPGWKLMGKYLAREATPAEQEQVEKWVALSDKNREELDKTRQLLEKSEKFYQLKSFDSAVAWKKVHQNIRPAINSNYRRKTLATFYKYAAIILVALLLGSVGYYYGFKNPIYGKYAEIVSPDRQVVNELVLPDGSVVTLNSNSKLQFPKKFKKNLREVTITGEAFFDVKPDPEKPFIIHAGNAQVKVLGTSFNVCAYPERDEVEVVVETGTVQVVCSGTEKTNDTAELLLKAGEKGTLLNSVNKLEKSLNTSPNYLAWKTHNLFFNKTPLDEVIQHLNKTYHTDIQLEEEHLKNLVLSARFEKKPVDFILNVVQLTFGLELARENGTYILSENKTSAK